MKYPYIPKSNQSLRKGDYWIINRDDGYLSVGIVIDIPPPEMKLRVEFIAGLLDWKGKREPTIKDLKNRKIIKQGKAHIKTITFTGKKIVGNINLESSGIKPLIQRSQIGFQPDAFLLKGYEKIKNPSFLKGFLCGRRDSNSHTSRH